MKKINAKRTDPSENKKRSVYQKVTTILNVHANNNVASKYIKQNSRAIKGEINKSIIPLSVTDSTTKFF